jgi:hypothetical protein
MSNTLKLSSARPRHRHLTLQAVRNGHGIVARKAFSLGETICEIKGRIVHASTLWRWWDGPESEQRRAENCYRYDAGRYLDPHGEISEYANHSCAPNAGIVKRERKLWFIALTDIVEGDEITHDYATLLGADDIWNMPCNCGAASCRGTVENVMSLPHTRFFKLAGMGVIPTYILRTALPLIARQSATPPRRPPSTRRRG